MPQATILSVGANGRFAGLVVPELVRRGATVRGFVRDADKAKIARANGATEIALGDLRDRASVDEALRGVTGVFYIGPGFAPDEAELGLAMVDAAQRAGVRRFVFSSVFHPSLPLANHQAKLPVEVALYESHLEYVILQPTTFYQILGAGWKGIIERGVVAEPFSQTQRLARVDYRDVAEVAAIALTDERLAFGTFELTADTSNRVEVATLIGAVLGRPITTAAPSFDEWFGAVPRPYDDGQKAMLRAMYAHYDADGTRANPLTLRAILEREPRTLRAYFEELAARES